MNRETDKAEGAHSLRPKDAVPRRMRVSESQRSNRLLKYVHRNHFVFANTVYDFEPGSFFGVFFLSFLFHAHSPRYFYERIEKAKSVKTKQEADMKLVLLLHVDADLSTPGASAAFSNLQLNCMSFGVQLIPSYSPDESAAYLSSMLATEQEKPELLRNPRGALRRQMAEQEKKEKAGEASLVRYISDGFTDKANNSSSERFTDNCQRDTSRASAQRLLFLSSLPMVTSRDARQVAGRYPRLRDAFVDAVSGQINVPGLGGKKRKELASFVMHPFK